MLFRSIADIAALLKINTNANDVDRPVAKQNSAPSFGADVSSVDICLASLWMAKRVETISRCISQ